MEEWRRFRDTKYEVSNLGRVRNRETGVILKQQYKYSGRLENDYLTVGLYLREGKKRFRTHRLVAEVFISNPENKPEVNHKNNKRDDNRAENLEWCSCQENSDYSYMTNDGKKSKKIPVKLINKEGKEYVFDSKYKAAQFIKENVECKSSVEKVRENISIALTTGYLVRGYRVEIIK